MVRPADLFFTTSTSIISKFIRFRTWGKYSHVQIINIYPEVISADEQGVMVRNVREEELQDYAILTCPSLTEGQRHDILDFCLHQVGKGYDFLGLVDFLINEDIQDEDRFFCSELAFLAYQAAKVDLVKRLDHAFVSPMHLLISPLLEVVKEKGGE